MTKTQTIGLIEVTSKTQANNGTQCFHDPITNCDYISYESGYVRRKYSAKNWRGRTITTIYQVNKTRKVEVKYNYSGKLRSSNRTERILEMNPEKRIDILCRAVINYRNYKA
jgi:hypothetical protein